MSSQLPERSSNRESAESRPRVLIVDDEESIRMALTRYFARRGWEVCEARDGDQARQLLAPNAGRSFDIVICDLRMPRFSGFDLFRWLAYARPEVAARIVFSSGDADAPETAAFLREARRPVLPKPFELCELGRIVEEIRGAAQAA